MSNNDYVGFLRVMTASRTLKASDLEAMEKKREELGIDDDAHSAALATLGITTEEVDLMTEKGVALDAYMEQASVVISSNFEPATQFEDLAKLLTDSSLTEDDHAYTLNRLGWTIVDFDAVKEGLVRTDTLEPYKVFLNGTLQDDSAQFNLLAHEKVVEMRRKYGVNDAEHERVLGDLGLTVDEYHTKRIIQIKAATDSLNQVAEDLAAKTTEANTALSGVKADIDTWKTEHKPLLDEKDAIVAKLKAVDDELRPKKEAMKKMQTRLNVVKKRNAKAIEETRAYTEEMTTLGKTGEGSEAVRLLGKLNAIKADTRQMEEDNELNKESLATGVVQLKQQSNMEKTFLNFHRICLAVKISIQNHETSNVLVEELWEDAKSLPTEEWQGYIRMRLMPSAKEGFKGTRDTRGGLIEWLVGAITGANKG